MYFAETVAFLSLLERWGTNSAPQMRKLEAQSLLPVPKADASHAEGTGKSACATIKKPEQAMDRSCKIVVPPGKRAGKKMLKMKIAPQSLLKTKGQKKCSSEFIENK